jgi:hypothetical protein
MKIEEMEKIVKQVNIDWREMGKEMEHFEAFCRACIKNGITSGMYHDHIELLKLLDRKDSSKNNKGE